MKQKAFFIIFKKFSVARNCLTPDTALLTILSIKRDILCNFAKIVLHGFEISITIDCKSSILSLYSLLKIMSIISISDLNKRGLFFKFSFYIQRAPILVSQGLRS